MGERLTPQVPGLGMPPAGPLTCHDVRSWPTRRYRRNGGNHETSSQLGQTARPAAAATVPFRASFSGSFTVVDRVCPNGDDHLHFTGEGIATQGGAATIAGDSCLHPDPANPACLIIDTDATTITAADGSTIRLASSGEDCLNRATGQITGSGTYSITGGTARFDGAAGAGEVSLAAQLMQVIGSDGSGTFGPLSFAGTITT